MNDKVGKVIEVSDHRLVKIESVFVGPLETFYLVRWMDTNEVFCEYPDKIDELIKHG